MAKAYDHLNPFIAPPAALTLPRRPVLPAPRVVFQAAPHLTSDMALGAGREVPESAPAGAEDWHA